MHKPAMIPAISGFDGDLYFRHERYSASEWHPHAHPWGQFNFVCQGVMHVEIGAEHFLSTPIDAIWIPPGVDHFSYTHKETVYRSAYLALARCSSMPSRPCTARVSPILRAILDDFSSRDVRTPVTPEDLRLAHVAVDQIVASPMPHGAYLPQATSKDINLILECLHNDPGDRRTLTEFARQVHSSARTIERKCLMELGMPLGEWRQRLRFVVAIKWLEEGQTVQRIASNLGYATTSAFIVMFRRIAGTTPDNFRRLDRS